MRPDKSCVNGTLSIPLEDFPYFRTGACDFHYMKGNKHRCKIFDKIKLLLKKKKLPRALLKEHTLDFVRRFYKMCVTLETIIDCSNRFSEGCIKCGDCCLNLTEMQEFPIERLVDWTVKTNPRTNKPINGMCFYLEYHPEFDNNTDDLGFRCRIYGKPERPKACTTFPDGKEENILECLLENMDFDTLELYFTRLPQCPARFKLVMPY